MSNLAVVWKSQSQNECVRFLLSRAVQRLMETWQSPFGCVCARHCRDAVIFASIGIRRCPSTVSCTVPSGESPNFRWIPSWEANWQSNRLDALPRGISLSEYGSEGFRVRLRRLSEYGSVAYLLARRFGYFIFLSKLGSPQPWVCAACTRWDH